MINIDLGYSETKEIVPLPSLLDFKNIYNVKVVQLFYNLSK